MTERYRAVETLRAHTHMIRMKQHLIQSAAEQRTGQLSAMTSGADDGRGDDIGDGHDTVCNSVDALKPWKLQK